MARIHKIFLIFGLTAFGIWGCSKAQTPTVAEVSNLNAKVAKLEDDLRAITASRDNFRQKLAALEEKFQAATQASTKKFEAEVLRGLTLSKERDAALANLVAKSQEKDQLQVQFDGFRKNLKELIGQAEVALASPVKPPLPVAPVSLPKPPSAAPTGS